MPSIVTSPRHHNHAIRGNVCHMGAHALDHPLAPRIIPRLYLVEPGRRPQGQRGPSPEGLVILDEIAALPESIACIALGKYMYGTVTERFPHVGMATLRRPSNPSQRHRCKPSLGLINVPTTRPPLTIARPGIRHISTMLTAGPSNKRKYGGGK